MFHSGLLLFLKLMGLPTFRDGIGTENYNNINETFTIDGPLQAL